MKAVRGGSWLEYLSIHCSSCWMGPASNVVCPEEQKDMAMRPIMCQIIEETASVSLLSGTLQTTSTVLEGSFPLRVYRLG